MISRAAIRPAVDVQGVVDRLVDAGDPIDSHPLQVDGLEIRRLEDELAAVLERWLVSRKIEIGGEPG